MDSRPSKNTLKFDRIYLQGHPQLGFDFRYQADFWFTFPISQLPEGGTLHALLRVTPNGKSATLLGEGFDIPSVSDALKQAPRDFFGELVADFGGSFSVGPGVYQVELLLATEDGRSFFKRWKLKTERTDDAASVAKANTVDSVVSGRMAGKLDPNGLRVTILLNATTVDTHNAKLWEYRFLMQMVSSVMERVPCRSLRLVAFNLDNEAELFRRGDFDSEAWKDLETALKNPQFATIDYRGLVKGSEPDYLARLVKREADADPDALILIGRSARFVDKTPKELRPILQPAKASIFYLQQDWQTNEGWGCPCEGCCSTAYSEHPFPFPDGLAYLVKDLRGTVLHFWTAREFSKALNQLRATLVGAAGGGANAISLTPAKGP